jgi:hypothetical protein
MKETPQIHPALINYLESVFKPILNSREVDIREIDYRSGQYSVVEHLRQLAERQKNNGSKNT